MDRTRTNTRESTSNDNPDLRDAERRVDRDIERFNSAVDNLADKIDRTSNQVQRAAYKARHPSETIKRATAQARDAAMAKMRSYQPTIDRYRELSKDRSSRFANQTAALARQNRGPIALVVLSFIGAWLASAYSARRRHKVIIKKVRPPHATETTHVALAR